MHMNRVLIFLISPFCFLSVSCQESCVGLSGENGQCMKTLDCLRSQSKHVGQCTLSSGRVASCCIPSSSTSKKEIDESKEKEEKSTPKRLWSSKVTNNCQIVNSQRSRNGRILGGVEITDADQPSVVKIMYNYGVFLGYKLLCGGTLLRNGWVLTAAHCLETDVDPTKTRYGVYNPSTREREYYRPRRTIRHPEWNWNSETFSYDAALVKLNISNSKISQLKPACVSPTRNLDNVTASVSGWGIQDLRDRTSVSDEMKELKVQIYPNNQCFFKKVQDVRFVESQMMCAAQDIQVTNQDPCKGDSGGGLVVDGEAVVGVLSWGLSCGRQNRPSVYQRVASIFDWIQNITKK